MQRRSALVLSLVAACGWAGCSFDVAGITLDGAVSTHGQDLAVDDLAVDDASHPADLAGLCASGGPQLACSSSGTELVTCMNGAPMAMSCAHNCSDAGGVPHCGRLDPTGPALPGDYEEADLADVVVTGTVILDTDDGSITSPTGDFTRSAGSGVLGGIGFRTAAQPGGPSIGIFSFRSLRIHEMGEVTFAGSNAASLVASGDVELDGQVDAQGSCSPTAGAYASAGAGGAPSSGMGDSGSGAGGGGAGAYAVASYAGGGGGGNGSSGGAGTTAGSSAGGIAGVRNGGLGDTSPTLVGGGGGGAGSGDGSMSGQGGQGGAGGGAVQIATNGKLVLGSLSIVLAGGCHGNPSAGSGGGGGGGAGGAIWLEASMITIAADAIVAANGGAGAGGGANAGSGNDGQDSAADAQGGMAGVLSVAGGNGGFSMSLPGQPGATTSTSVTAGGGGGGAVGTIALRSASGSVGTANATMSPAIGATNQSEPAPAFVGTASFD